MRIIKQILKNKETYFFLISLSIIITVYWLLMPFIHDTDISRSYVLEHNTELYTDYSASGNNEKNLKVLEQGTTVSILTKQDGWMQVQTADGIVGWISMKEEKANTVAETVDNPIHMVATITSDRAIVYSQPNTTLVGMGDIGKYGHLLLLQDVGNGWIQVQYNGSVGWVESKNVTISKIVSTIGSEQVFIFQKPDKKSPIIASPQPGSALELLDEQGDYYKVRFEGKEGFVETGMVTHAIGTLRDMLKDQAGLPTAQSSKKIMVAKLNQTPIYTEKDVFSQVAETVTAATQFTYEDREGDYYGITLKNGKKGYIPYWLVLTNFAPIESDSSIPTSLANATVVIDPGHGGIDPGAVVDFHHLHEADLTLSTSLILKQLLEKEGTKVIMTRTDNSSLGLVDRAKISNEQNADIFLSLHFDSADDNTLSGTTVYYYNKHSQALAETIRKYLATKLRLPNNGAYFENYAVIRENKQPSLLIELGYLNSRSDNAIITTTSYQEETAKALVDALKEYFQ